MEMKTDLARFDQKQLQLARKVIKAGRKHPEKEKFYVSLLVILVRWFKLQIFCRKHKAVMLAALCGIILIILGSAALMEREGAEVASKVDRELLRRQQEQLLEIRDEVSGSTDSTGWERDFILALMQRNADTVGWLTIPGTKIDYPVMQTPEEEDYYLYRDFYGYENKNGCLILAAGCDTAKESTNWIIHGHNMKSGDMFGSLLKYRKKSYLQEHNLIFLETLEGKRVYEILAVFESQVYYENQDVFKFYEHYDIEDKAEFYTFYKNIKNLSLYDIDTTAVYGDHFLTLSTCSYHTENGRFVVVAKEIY